MVLHGRGARWLGALVLIGSALAITTRPAVATGSTTLTPPLTPPLTWTQPSNPDPMRGWPASIDCVSTHWCMAVDISGQAVGYSSGKWQAAVRVESPTPENGLYSVSCPSTTMCLAVDGEGRVTRYNGHTWTTPGLINGSYRAGPISCPVATFCMSLGERVEIFNGSTWSVTSNPLPKSALFTTLSCSSSSFCMSTYYTNATGNIAWVYRNHTWTRSASLFHIGGDTLFALSCTSHRFCMAIGDQEIAEHWNGTTWIKTVRTEFSGDSVFELSCTSFTYCLSVGSLRNGVADTSMSTDWNGHVWGHPQQFDARFVSIGVSCAPGTSSCQAVDQQGHAMWHAHGTWQPRALFDRSHGEITAVSCGSTRCVAVDAAGRALWNDGGTWATSHKIDNLADFDSGSLLLSCAHSNFCLTVDTYRRAHRLDGDQWSGTATAPFAPAAVSCLSFAWCLAMSDLGQLSVYNGSTWSTPRLSFRDLSGHGSQWALSCATRRFCAAYDSDGLVRTYDGTSWSAGRSLGAQFQAAVSCPTATFCMATGGNGLTWRYDGTGWHKLATPAQDTTTVSCVSTQFCISTGSAGDVFTYAGGGWQSSAGFDLPSYGYFTTSSCASTFCVAATPIQVTIGTAG
jgi:hypothetical protein